MGYFDCCVYVGELSGGACNGNCFLAPLYHVLPQTCACTFSRSPKRMLKRPAMLIVCPEIQPQAQSTERPRRRVNEDQHKYSILHQLSALIPLAKQLQICRLVCGSFLSPLRDSTFQATVGLPANLPPKLRWLGATANLLHKTKNTTP